MGKTNKEYEPVVGSTMSLGDHLEELRTRILLALAGLALAFILCLVFGKQIISFAKWPYVTAVTQVLEEEAREQAKDEQQTGSASEQIPKPIDVSREVILTTLAPAEVIISYIKICLISGLLLSSPWVFYQLWMFVAAGLYPHERRYVNVAAPFSALLFIAGALFFLSIVAPICLKFFIKSSDILGLSRNWTLQYYITFISHMMLIFGLAFQTPSAIFFLNRTGLVSLKAFSDARKYVVLGIVIIAAMATPPDVVSQIALAVPLYFLFELGIILSWLAARQRSKSEDSNQANG